MKDPDRNASGFLVELPNALRYTSPPLVPKVSVRPKTSEPFAKLSPGAVAFWMLVVEQGG